MRMRNRCIIDLASDRKTQFLSAVVKLAAHA